MINANVNSSIIYKNHLVLLEGFDYLTDKDVNVYFYYDLGFITPKDVKLYGAVHEEQAHIMTNGVIDSQLLFSDMLEKSEQKCYYHEDLNAYFWIRSKHVLKKHLDEFFDLMK